jgi:hypothetical protein
VKLSKAISGDLMEDGSDDFDIVQGPSDNESHSFVNVESYF